MVLEENILKVNYKSFTQIVILGSSTFVPFMQLTTANRREVIEDFWILKIFSSMNTIIKEKIRQKG
jgi:DNA repair exonuclease SbcCD ATPase subunit